MALVAGAVYVDGRRVADPGSAVETVREARKAGGLAWIGLYRPSADELGAVATLLGLPPSAVEDTLLDHERPKLQLFGDQAFVVLRTARYIDKSESVEFGEVHVFAGADFVVTVRHAEAPDLALVRERMQRHPEDLAFGPLAVVSGIFQEVVAHYQPVIDGLENDIDEIEDQLFNGDPEVAKRIFSLSREVIDFQHSVAPLVGMIESLEEFVGDEMPSGGGGREVHALRDTAEHARRVVERADGFRHTLDNALVVHSTLIEQERNAAMHRMAELGLAQNEQVKKVSGWAAILFAPTLVGTIYGMNFTHMPELNWTFGYPVALGLMVATSATLYFVFKGKGWL